MTQEDFFVYYDAAIFPDKTTSGRAYHQLQDFIYVHDYTLSVYRFLLNDALHVLVIGERPPQQVCERMHRILEKGCSVQMSHDDLTVFLQRSLEKWKHGDSEYHNRMHN
jgi:hypothetical protein